MCPWFHGFLNPFKILPVPQLPNHFLAPPPPNPVNTDRQNQLVNIPWQSKFIPQLSTFNHGTFSSPDIKLVRLIIVNPISKHNLDCNLINFTAFNKTYLTHIFRCPLYKHLQAFHYTLMLFYRPQILVLQKYEDIHKNFILSVFGLQALTAKFSQILRFTSGQP